MVELAIHSKSFNVARRFTAQNDHDIMHCCVEETMDEDNVKSPGKYDYLSCQELATHLVNAKQLPPQCNQYRDLVTTLRRRETDTTNGTEVLS